MASRGARLAGESARSEYERIRDDRRERIRNHGGLLLGLTAMSVVGGALAMHVLLGVWWAGALAGLLPIVSILAPSQREVSWRKGTEGEQAVARALDELPSSRALHDRRIPGSRANIDHILVAPTGVWTIDAKNYTGKLETRRRGQELWVKGRNRSKLLEQARRQAAVVGDVLSGAGVSAVPIRPALCFLGVAWPLLFTPREAGDVVLISPRRLSRLAVGSPGLSARQIEQVAVVLDRELQPAAGATSHGSAPRSRSNSRTSNQSSRPEPRMGASDVTVKPWRRYGKNRLYVNASDGTTLGYVDLQTNAVVPTEERYRDTVGDAVSRYLREN